MGTLTHALFAVSLAEQKLMLDAIDSVPARTRLLSDIPCVNFAWVESEQQAISSAS
jgi:hypothetical protein